MSDAPEYIIGYVMLAATVALGAGFIYTAVSARKGPDDYERIHDGGDAVRRHRFSTPGTYFIRCLEPCGLSHTAMASLLTVTPVGG